ncbi:MAG TPA: DUF21 domain-containing protein [bacterium (Candidatus Stahlbacteria)]|nr:DUF21 domain-containing protein [Candidatus Stahlbacteria bacterium]
MVGSQTDLLIAGIGLVGQAFFAAAETALITVDHFRIKILKQKYAWARRVEYFQMNPEIFFSTILICEDIALVVTTTFLTRYIINFFGPVGTIYSVIIISFLSLILAQILPKGIAMSRNVEYLTRSIYLIHKISFLLMPLILIIKKVTNLFLQFYPREEFTHLLAHEIVEGFRDAKHNGYLSKKADRIAERLNLARRLRLSDVMIPIDKVVSVTDLLDLNKILGDQIYSRIPVIKDGKITGLINVKEYIYTGRIEMREPLIVDSDTKILMLLRIMKDSGEQLAVVVDSGKPLGIVTLEDLIEELIGEIEEEF